jgi:MFS transporter, PPP family, 3-phenylpropionic acid transporter
MSVRRAQPPVRPEVAIRGAFVLFGIAIAAFFPFLALFLSDRGLSPSRIGLVIAAMAVARVLSNPVWGHVADTSLGRRTTLQVGLAGGAAAALWLFGVDTWVAILLAAVIFAAFQSATGPNIDAIALEHLGEQRMSDYGRIRAWESLSYAVGCFTIGWLLQGVGTHWTMVVYAVASIALLGWTFTIVRDRPTRLEDHGRLGAVGAAFRAAPRFWRFLAAVLLLWTGFNAAWNFFALKIASEGGGPFLVGLGTALGGLAEVPMMRVSSRLQRRWGLRKVYALGCLIYALGFLLWGVINDPTIVSLLTVFEGMGFALLFTTSVVVVGRLLPPTLYSTGQSMVQTVALGIAPILGAGIGGVVFQNLGPLTLYVGASCLAVCGAIGAWFALSSPAVALPEAEVDTLAAAGSPPPEPFA